jgi:hypothetical protein
MVCPNVTTLGIGDGYAHRQGFHDRLQAVPLILRLDASQPSRGQKLFILLLSGLKSLFGLSQPRLQFLHLFQQFYLRFVRCLHRNTLSKTAGTVPIFLIK